MQIPKTKVRHSKNLTYIFLTFLNYVLHFFHQYFYLNSLTYVVPQEKYSMRKFTKTIKRNISVFEKKKLDHFLEAY